MNEAFIQAAPSLPTPHLGWSGDCTGKVHLPGPRVALTFDDGPSGQRTEQILDLLAAPQAQATFFLVGRNIPAQVPLVRRQWEDGHELAVHTWSHQDLARIGEGQRQVEIARGLSAVQRAVPEASIRWWRAPYGSAPGRGQPYATRLGLQGKLWDIDTQDWRGVSALAMASGVVQAARSGAVVLEGDMDVSDPSGLAKSEQREVGGRGSFAPSSPAFAHGLEAEHEKG